MAQISFELKVGDIELSGVAWAEKPDRHHGDTGLFQFKTLTLEHKGLEGIACSPLRIDEWQLAMLAELGMPLAWWEQAAFEQWQAGGYEG